MHGLFLGINLTFLSATFFEFQVKLYSFLQQRLSVSLFSMSTFLRDLRMLIVK